MSTRALLVAAALFAASLAGAQVPATGDPPYARLLEAYVRDDPAAAAATLATWPESRVKDAVRALDKQAGRDRARAAIMLHTETALGEAANGRESFHVEVARSFIKRLDRADRDFVARWHALVAALYCMRQDTSRARLEINQGLAVDGKHRDVNLAAGALIEHEVAQEEPNLRGQWNVTKERDDILRKRLRQAAQIYRVVLDGHPDFLEARLRLGWVLTLNDSLPAAREQLDMVAARATNADVSYLAHMFLAALHERADHPAEAAREYELARQVAPYQSSLVALIRSTAAAGDVESARALADEIPKTVAGQDDPWNSYNLCFTGDGLFTGLRAAVRAP
jgi:tetratricopeptide (TPR) repeat protein